MPRVAGLDGCRGGWVLVTLDLELAAAPTVERIEDLAIIGERVTDGDLILVGIDMPIGLTDRGRRLCDVEARKLLGPRRSSVFPAPIHAVLHETDYQTALARSREIHGVGLSKQAFNLLPAIRQVDALVNALDGEPRSAIREVHPELAFARLAGGPLPEPKRIAAGLAHRQSLIAGVLPQLADAAESRPPRTGADDVLDAAAVAWSSRLIARGDGRSVGDDVARVWW